MTARTFTAVFEYDSASQLYVGSIPQLPGAATQGATLDELRDNLQEVAELVIADMLAHGEELPTGDFVGVHQLTVQV